MNITRIPDVNLLKGVANTHPCIFKADGQNWMTYRHEQGEFNKNTRVAICECDENWNPKILTSRILGIPRVKIPGGDEVVEDCRAVRVGLGSEHVLFNVSNRETIGIFGGDGFVNWIGIPDKQPIEKNWQFFELFESGDSFLRKLFAVRWIKGKQGHEIYAIDRDKWTAELMHTDPTPWDWAWGVIHGGTSPVLYGNMFISMFHSYTIGFPPFDGKAEAKEQVSNKEVKVYFGAPYAFDAFPPFKIRLIPKYPMLWPQLHTPENRSPNGHYVVFPTGLLFEDNRWICTYGDDLHAWKAEFTNEELNECLMPI